MVSWLFFADKRLQLYFAGLFVICVGLGCTRFLFPFQMIYLGGDTILISTTGTLFAFGQIISFLLLTRIIKGSSSLFFFGGSFLLVFILAISVITDSIVLTFFKLFDGLGTGLIFFGIISLASDYPTHEGELLGGLFAAVFGGLALGQGIGGFLLSILVTGDLSFRTSSIQSINLFLFVLSLISFTLLRPKINIHFWKELKNKKWQHIHIYQWLGSLLTIKPFVFLLAIYFLYDFAHGLYTPNLSILLTQQGIDEFALGLGYLFGDITWGISQIFAGRLVDKYGHYLPLGLSLCLKGFIVFLYPEIQLLIGLLVVLFFAGLAEGFLEPARNKAMLSIDHIHQYVHSHFHLDMGFNASGNFVLGVHCHDHQHKSRPETIIGTLQTAGILSFGLGSLLGSYLLSIGTSLEFVTIIGGICLIIASIITIFLYFSSKEKITS